MNELPDQAGLIRTPPEDYQMEDQIGFLLRRAYQRTTAHFNEVLAEFSVTPTQLAALCKLDELGSTSQNELGRQTAMDPATIWGVINRLIKRGWVSQAEAPNDGRLVMLDLTPKGRAVTREMKMIAGNVTERATAALSPEERRQLRDLLRRIV